jgi:hypothetical protein
MNTLSELDTGLANDLNTASNSTLFPSPTRLLALNRAYIKCGRLFRWKALEDAKKTSTAIAQEYYDYPQTWSPDSIWRLEVNGVRYGESPDGSPMAFEDYLVFREDDTNSSEKKWATQWLRFFIYPVPTTVISNGIVIWGQKNVTELVNSSDTTIFSYNMPECNEAIMLEAKAILKNKAGNEKSGQFFSAEAKQILVIAWNKLQQEKAKHEKTQPFFEVPDFFSGKSRLKEQVTGNF